MADAGLEQVVFDVPGEQVVVLCLVGRCFVAFNGTAVIALESLQVGESQGDLVLESISTNQQNNLHIPELPKHTREQGLACST